MGLGIEGDRNLLDRFRQGEQEILAQIYRAYVRRVELLVRGLLRRRWRGELIAAEQCEDLVQEAFARAFTRRAREAFDESRDYGAYLLVIARNVVIDVLRSGRREVPANDAFIEDCLELRAANSEVEEQARWNDPATIALVRQYLANLSPELQLVHHQRHVLENAQVTAASALGMSRRRMRTLEKRIHAGLSRMIRPDRLRAGAF
jgi:RNA polymerase sigma factor (sigma-70 family)